MKAIWKGSIGFGLVNIPVRLFSAIESSSLDFDMLDRKDHARVRYIRVNENTNKEVEWGNIVKGYMHKDDYVVLEDEDFEEAAPEKTKMIDIHQFADEKEVDTMLYETPYYLEPEKTGTKAYGLLREALKKSGKVGVSTFVMRNAEILAMIKPYDKLLVLFKLRFPEEIRDTKELALPPAASVKPAELKIALALIKQFSNRFDPVSYKNEYSNELMKIIKAKAAGKRTKVRKLPIMKVKEKDLMAQLKASLTTKRKAS